MTEYSLGNLLMMFDESLRKIIDHLEQGHNDRALTRAKITHSALQKLIGHCVTQVHDEIERKL